MKRIKQIKTEINKIAKDLLKKYPELDTITMDCCYGTDGQENPMNVSLFAMQEIEK